jgi:hypothetical protein
MKEGASKKRLVLHVDCRLSRKKRGKKSQVPPPGPGFNG